MKRQKQIGVTIVTARISPAYRKALKKQADQKGMKFSAYISWQLSLLASKEQSHV